MHVTIKAKIIIRVSAQMYNGVYKNIPNPSPADISVSDNWNKELIKSNFTSIINDIAIPKRWDTILNTKKLNFLSCNIKINKGTTITKTSTPRNIVNKGDKDNQ